MSPTFSWHGFESWPRGECTKLTRAKSGVGLSYFVQRVLERGLTKEIVGKTIEYMLATVFVPSFLGTQWAAPK